MLKSLFFTCGIYYVLLRGTGKAMFRLCYKPRILCCSAFLWFIGLYASKLMHNAITEKDSWKCKYMGIKVTVGTWSNFDLGPRPYLYPHTHPKLKSYWYLFFFLLKSKIWYLITQRMILTAVLQSATNVLQYIHTLIDRLKLYYLY